MAISFVSSRKNALPYHELSESSSLHDDRKLHSVKCPDTLSHALVRKALEKRLSSIDYATCQPGEEDPFFVCDLGIISRNHQTWRTHLPRIEPFYAVKCNGDPGVLRLLAFMGLGFDCASQTEISTMLDLGVDPEKIIFANPCKTSSYIRYAEQVNVKKMTFDNLDELSKIARFYPEAECLLRVATDDSAAQCQLSTKFGAFPSDTRALLSHAKSLNVNVVGVAFHVGSGCSDPNAFLDAVARSRAVFDEAEALGMPPMSILDVGGGFQESTFEEAAQCLNKALDIYFGGPTWEYLKIIAEPGRFYVANAFVLAANVIAKRSNTRLGVQERSMVYLNDGVYGNLNSILFDHQEPEPCPLLHDGLLLYGHEPDGPCEFSLWGPTCDGLDCISKQVKFPVPVNVGDWICFRNMGAYTLAASTTFNGFNCVCDVLYVCSTDL